MACMIRLSLFSKSTFYQCRSVSLSLPLLSARPKKAKNKRVLEKVDTFLNRKIQYNKQKRKTQWYDTPMGIGGAGGFGAIKKGPTQGSRRRAHQLSVFLSQYVISLINSGELDPRLPDLGVDIVRVKLVPDLGAMHVYWLATGSSDDEVIEDILKEASYKLRNMLTGLHVMNYPPPVLFIKDFSQVRLQQVEALLEQADMGPDHEPTELGADMKSDITLPYHYTTPDMISPSSLQSEMETIGEKLTMMDFRTAEDGAANGESARISPHHSEQGYFETPVSVARNSGRIFSGDGIKTAELDDLDINLRSDIYDIDHSALIQKVLQIKRRKVNRCFQISAANDDLLRFNPDQKVMADLSKQDIQKFLATRKHSAKRESSKNYLDSSLYRGEVDDYSDEDYAEDVDVDYDDEYKT